MTKQAPYFNTHNDADQFLQVLFRAEKPVQARELNELQSISSSQLAKFANHMFKNGAAVSGGGVNYKKIYYIQLEETYSGNSINPSLFMNKRIIEKDNNNNETGIVAYVLQYSMGDNQDPNAVYVEFETKTGLTPGNNIFIEGTSIGAKIKSSSTSIGLTNFLGVSKGTFFINGRFVDLEPSSIILDKFSINSTGKAGFLYSEYIVDEFENETLLDPATDYASAYSPGAHRLQYKIELKYYPSTAVVPANFINLLDIIRGENTTENTTQYNEISKELARRTYEESGNYTVSPFSLTLEEDNKNIVTDISFSGNIITVTCARSHELSVNDIIYIRGVEGVSADLYNGKRIVLSIINNNKFTFQTSSTPETIASGSEIYFSNDNYYVATLGVGRAYVNGYRYENSSPLPIKAKKARNTQKVENYSISTLYGSYVIVKNVSGFFDPSILQTVYLHTSTDGTGIPVGSAKLRYVRYNSGTYGTSSVRFRFYLYDIRFSSSVDFSSIKSIKNASSAIAIIAEESIESSRTKLFTTDIKSFLFPITQTAVKTLKPSGSNTLTYTVFKKFSVAASGSTASVNVTGQDYFIGPSNINFAGTDNHLSNYTAFDANTGVPITINSITLTSNNQVLNLNITPSGSDVRLIAPVQVVQTNPKTKTLVTGTKLLSVNTISNTSREIILDNVDILDIVSIRDSKNGNNPTGTEDDIKEWFLFDNGQRDAYYDFGTVTLKNNYPIPTGKVLITYRYFQHSGSTYFSVDSYSSINYRDIPSYTFENGNTVKLSDTIDFRPIKLSNGTHQSGDIPSPNGIISSDYEFYLPRKDVIVISANSGTFDIIEGISSTNPQYPPVPEDTMALYKVNVPAYTSDAKEIEAKFIENKRYTMRDIGIIDKRVDRLEYYTTLSMLELETKNRPVKDQDGFERFKNGLIVDNFRSYSTADVFNGDYKAALDYANGELRPSFNNYNVKMKEQFLNNVILINDNKYGKFITLPYTTETLYAQLLSSKAESVNPFLVYKHNGVMYCNPSSDDWIDTTTNPDLLVNEGGTQDNIEFLTESAGSQWSSWSTNWFGDNRFTTDANAWGQTNTANTTTINSSRNIDVTKTNITFKNVENNLGERIVDANVIPYMRAVSIKIIANGMRKNRDIHVFFDNEKVNSLVTPSTGFSPSSEGSCRTNSLGNVEFTLNIPAGKYRTGQKVIKIIDEANNIDKNSTTSASYVFYASGLSMTKERTILSTRQPEITQTTSTRVDTISIQVPIQQQNNNDGNGSQGEGTGGADPFAQMFPISSTAYPYGLYVKRVKVYLRQKGTAPLELHIRPTVNGFPSSSDILPMSRVVLQSGDVAIPQDTDDITSILNSPTVFEFPVPIYLKPGQSYAFVLYAPDPDYEAYICELGEKVIGTEVQITNTGLLGPLFKSKNMNTWSPFQNEVLMCSIDKLRFTGDSGNVILYADYDNQPKKYSTIFYSSDHLDMSPVSNIEFEYSSKDANNLSFIDYTTIFNKENIDLSQVRIVDSADALKIKASLSTTNYDVAPLLDLSKNSIVLVENIINNLGLVEKDLVLLSAGTGYTSAPTVTVTGGNGSGAVLTATVSGGLITKLNIINSGSGYTSEPTITISGGNGTGGSAVYKSFETDSNGGNALARYVSRKITLTDDFETNHVKVWLDQNLPSTTDIKVYAKYKSINDPSTFEMRPWVELEKTSGLSIISSDKEDFREVAYEPVNKSISYTSNGVTYSRSKYVAFKIVMLSNNGAKVPRAKAFRGITTVNA